VKLLYGQAFRAPNAFESSYETSTFRINPALQPEQIRSYELVLEQTLSPQLRLSASAFHNRIVDLISENYDVQAEKFFFANGAEVETTGASLELEARLRNGIRGRASYTLQETIDTQTNRELSNSPRHLAKLNLMLPIYKDTIATGIELQYMSEVEGGRGNPVPGSVVVNWNLTTRELLKGLETSVGVYNLFDQDYAHPADGGHRQNSIEQDGRTFRLKFNYKF
jgi:outer membrane receptor for ferrienterochelin and colicins